MSSRNELVGTILGVIQRTADVQGNVTMIRLAENIAAELCESTLRARVKALRDDYLRRAEYGDISLDWAALALTSLLDEGADSTDGGCAACGEPRWRDSALCESCHRDSSGGVA